MNNTYLYNYLVQLKAHHEEIWRGIRWDEQAEAYQRGCIDAIEDIQGYLEYNTPDRE